LLKAYIFWRNHSHTNFKIKNVLITFSLITRETYFDMSSLQLNLLHRTLNVCSQQEAKAREVEYCTVR
jgi:hypothetical protein